MFYEAELIYLNRVLKKMHLQSMIIDANAPLDSRADQGLRQLFGEEQNTKTFNDYFPHCRHNIIYRMNDIFFCNYQFLLLPGTNDNTVLLIGPYLSGDISRQQILEHSEQLGLQPHLVKDIENYYNCVPLISDTTFIFAVIDSFAEKIWGTNNYSIEDINHNGLTEFTPFETKKEALTSKDLVWKMHMMENRYEFENELMQAVSLGQVHKAELMFNSFSAFSFENRVSDQLRNIKNYFIIMNTLLRKAAESGGVHPIYLDNISSSYAKQIEQLTSTAATKDFMIEMFRDYCILVKDHSIKHYSQPVQKTITCIDADLTADLSLSKLAEINNVNASYLSTLFRSETGQTLTDFVNKRRVKMAKKLLGTTNLQIQTISQHCGILDVHYFSKMFKKYEGVTPKAYRESLTT